MRSVQMETEPRPVAQQSGELVRTHMSDAMAIVLGMGGLLVLLGVVFMISGKSDRHEKARDEELRRRGALAPKEPSERDHEKARDEELPKEPSEPHRDVPEPQRSEPQPQQSGPQPERSGPRKTLLTLMAGIGIGVVVSSGSSPVGRTYEEGDSAGYSRARSQVAQVCRSARYCDENDEDYTCGAAYVCRELLGGGW